MPQGRTILHVFPTFALGGVQLRMVDMMARLPRTYRHRVLSLDGRSDSLARIAKGVDVECLLPSVGLAGPQAIMGMRRWLLNMAPDLVCSYNWGAMDWAFATGLCRLPHVHFESGFGPEEAIAPLLRRDLYRRLALRRVHRLVVPAKSLHALAERRRWVSPDRLLRIVNGVDTAWFTPPPSRGGGSRVTVLALAPLRREKRLDRLMRLVASLAHVRLELVGDGPERARLAMLGEELSLGERLVFRGQQDDVRPMLHAADIFAMTSETEQMPNALLQAMASGLPVIAFAAGDIADMLGETSRDFVLAQDDDAGFARKLLRLALDPALRQEIGAANRARVVARHDIAEMARAYEALFEDAMEGRS